MEGSPTTQLQRTVVTQDHSASKMATLNGPLHAPKAETGYLPLGIVMVNTIPNFISGLLYILVPTVNRCPPVPEMAHAVPNSRLATKGTIIKYNCTIGFESDNSISECSASCDGDLWKTVEPCCQGNLVHGMLISSQS